MVVLAAILGVPDGAALNAADAKRPPAIMPRAFLVELTEPGVTPVPPMHRRATAALCRVIAQRLPTVPPVLVGVRKPGEARHGGEGAVMWEDEPMTDRPTCRRCGHLRVCHRRGRCEYVQRSGWVPSHNTFTTEVPCECEGWQEPK